MKRLEVHKFGGTSVEGVERMIATANCVADSLRTSNIVVVASAMAGVTDYLVSACNNATKQNLEQSLMILLTLKQIHYKVLDSLGGDIVCRNEIEHLVNILEDLLKASYAIGELTPKAMDRILSTGEKLSVRLLALAFRQKGLNAVYIDADTFLETDENHGEANPLSGIAEHSIQLALKPLIEKSIVPIVTGFCGRSPSLATTTLGRGGSDLSATVISAALKADEVVIWTDVDGVFTADPRVVPSARLIPQLNYREATEMSYYGAKVLHQRTILPVAHLGIPVSIKNSIKISSKKTVVNNQITPGSHPVKSITAIKQHCLVSIEGSAMAGVPGIAARVFQAMAKSKISVTMISQASSESNICFAIPTAYAVSAEMALKQDFRDDISQGVVEEIIVKQNVALLAIVGLGMAMSPGIAGRVFSCLGSNLVNVFAIAQGSSELNITCAIDASKVDIAINALHNEFGLHRIDTGDDSSDSLDLLLLGCGQIGKALLNLIERRYNNIYQRFGLKLRVVSISDRSGYIFMPKGISNKDIKDVVLAKEKLVPISDTQYGIPSDSLFSWLLNVVGYRLSNPILVDVSNSEDSYSLFMEATNQGCDIVTANKKPLAHGVHHNLLLKKGLEKHRKILRAEATVGAGLPIIDTVDMLLETGDELHLIEGCLSGTIGYIMSQLELGVKFSSAVKQAMELGYTEPDPVIDLLGNDVARKALIIGYFSNLVTKEIHFEPEPLVDPVLAGMEKSDLLEALNEYDSVYLEKVENAHLSGEVLRYIARVEKNSIKVGLHFVPKDSIMGSLKGTDNRIIINSERYNERPLVITGPGAGADVTAMGVLSDILRIAAERK